MAKLKHPSSQRPFFPESRSKNILTCPFYLLTLPSVFPMFHCLVTFFRSIYPSFHSLSQSSLTHSFTHKKTRLRSQTKSCPCTKTDTSLLAPLFFRSADEIFKRHFCSYLIARQHSLHKDSEWSELGNEAWVRLGSVMFSETQQGLERDGLSVRVLNVGMSFATTP